jgi:hypothetical protein
LGQVHIIHIIKESVSHIGQIEVEDITSVDSDLLEA